MTNKNPRFTKIVRLALPIAAVVGVLGVAGIAAAQDVPPPPPPPTFVATVDPVYYNGQPTYWYQNHWYWRDAGGRWSYYRDEPGFLRDHRMHPPERHYDEHRGWPRRPPRRAGAALRA